MRPIRRALALPLSATAAGGLLVFTPTAARADPYQRTGYVHEFWATRQTRGRAKMLGDQYVDYRCGLASGTPGWNARYRLYRSPR